MKFAPLLILISISSSLMAQPFEPFQNEDSYQVFLDLNKVESDRLPVEIVPPLLNVDSVEFHMPRIVPGTYDVHDYGRFINDFSAVNSTGDQLKVKRLDDNRWRIYDASKIYKITYNVDDTYDAEEETGIFQPAGTTLEDGVYLLNNFGFVGYLKGYKKKTFKLTVAKPEGFYGSTALRGEPGVLTDVYTVADYFTLHDNPIMYCIPDTATHMVGGAKVLVSVYSPEGTVSAKASMEEISEVLDAASDYLGGSLPVDKYAVLIYCIPLDQAGNSYGALEHHTSTVLYMPEFGGERFYSGVRDITAHEFFHIVTPLNIHSEMINDFNFIDPEMSQHIWLYEGVTEYNSHLVQIRSGIYSLEDYLEVLRGEMDQADGFNLDVPLTAASKYTLDVFKSEYHNFYQKGALAAMAVDLKLLDLSSGEYRLVNLLEELGNVYGPDTFFVDDQLFNIITEMTYAEMREFFARYFESAEPLPLQELLATAGIQYIPEAEVKQLSVGDIEFGYNFETGRIKVASTEGIDKFGKKLGWKEGDEIIEFNGQPLDLGNISLVIAEFYNNTKVGDKVVVKIARPDGKDDYTEKTLKAKARTALYTENNILQTVESPSADQLKRRKAWINQ